MWSWRSSEKKRGRKRHKEEWSRSRVEEEARGKHRRTGVSDLRVCWVRRRPGIYILVTDIPACEVDSKSLLQTCIQCVFFSFNGPFPHPLPSPSRLDQSGAFYTRRCAFQRMYNHLEHSRVRPVCSASEKLETSSRAEVSSGRTDLRPSGSVSTTSLTAPFCVLEPS